MYKDSVYKKCKDHNSSVRVLKEIGKSDLSELLSLSGRSMLVSGGSARERSKILCRAVSYAKANSPCPCIILSNNAETERELISLANANKLGPLYVCSEQYPEYDVFSGMSGVTVSSVFCMVGELLGYRNTSNVHNYSMAFLKLLNMTSGDRASLSDILAFKRNNKDAVIAGHAKSLGLEEEYSALSDPDAAKDFRNILRVIENAFSLLTTDSCKSCFSLINSLSSNAVIYIRTSTEHPEVLGAYFAAVLGSVCEKSFSLYLDDCRMLGSDKFIESIVLLKMMPGVTVNLFSKNASLYGSEELISSYPGSIILLDGEGVESSSIQQLFDKCFGEYTAYDVGAGASKPAHVLFSLERSPQINTLAYTRPKLLFEETVGYSAVIKGHNGPEIRLVRKLKM